MGLKSGFEPKPEIVKWEALTIGVIISASHVQLPASYRTGHVSARCRQAAHQLPGAGRRIALLNRVQRHAIGAVAT